jgi:hypothetical protein
MDHGADDRDRELTRIYFSLDHEDWHGRPNEGLWAEPIGGARPAKVFRLRNSPFFIRGVSFLDVVRALPRKDDVGMEFAGVVEHSGHSTYMLLVPPAFHQFEMYWDKLSGLGCSYESKSLRTSVGDKVLYSVDVPPSSDIHAVYSILLDGEHNGVWMFQEGHVGHKVSIR